MSDDAELLLEFTRLIPDLANRKTVSECAGVTTPGQIAAAWIAEKYPDGISDRMREVFEELARLLLDLSQDHDLANASREERRAVISEMLGEIL